MTFLCSDVLLTMGGTRNTLSERYYGGITSQAARRPQLAQRGNQREIVDQFGETWCYTEKPPGLIVRPVAAAPMRTSNLHRRC
jgi:hypothetical protein